MGEVAKPKADKVIVEILGKLLSGQSNSKHNWPPTQMGCRDTRPGRHPFRDGL